jgi:cytochrome c oxidase subunit 4
VSRSESAHPGHGSALGVTLALVALLTLAGLSLVLRFANLGTLGMGVALLIATAKAGIILVFFMEILDERPTVRFAFAAGLTLFALLLSLVIADVLTRGSLGPNPPGTAQRYRG